MESHWTRIENERSPDSDGEDSGAGYEGSQELSSGLTYSIDFEDFS
jgi:hypothetical protein